MKMKRCRGSAEMLQRGAEAVQRSSRGAVEVQRFRGPEVQGFKGLKGQVQTLRC